MKVRLAALVPVLAVVLAGCGGEDTPRPEPLPSPTPASPSPSALEVPPSAQAATPQGAAAFVRYYTEELGRTLSTQDTRTIERLSSPDCAECSSIVRIVQRDKAAGKRYTGGEVTVRTAEAVPVDGTKTAVTVVYDAEPVVLLGDPSASPQGGTKARVLEVEVTRSAQSWLVTKITEVAQ